jgi:hypothetical protein
MNFIKDELIHLVLTLGVFVLFYWHYQDWQLIIPALFFGFLIDVDHLFDYFAYFGVNFSLVNFAKVNSYTVPAGKVYVLLHGWEYVILFSLLGWLFENKLDVPGLAMIIMVSYLVHLVKDNFSSTHQPLAYSIIYRYLNHFTLAGFCGK